MRILACVAISGTVFFSGIFSAKAESLDAVDQIKNIAQEIKIKTSKNEISIENKQNFKSFNENFAAPTYIAEISEKARYANLFRISQIKRPASPVKGDFVMNASAYTAAADECGKSDGITASGKKVAEGRTLACPPVYKFGTKIEIDGMGTYVCEDRGGAIKGNHFDIYMQTKKQAFAFGRRNLVARVVN